VFCPQTQSEITDQLLMDNLSGGQTQCRRQPFGGTYESSTNAVMEREGDGLVREVDRIQTPMKNIFTMLCQARWLKI